MADSLSQDGREARLATPLGKDKLLLANLSGTEAVGELFEFRIDAIAEDEIDVDKMLGRLCSVHLDTSDQIGRDYSGIVAEGRYIGQDKRFRHYRLVLRPLTWILTLSTNCVIHENKNPRDLVKEILSEACDVKDLTTGAYPTLEYVVQYRETDFNFAMRLMEKYGIYFYFEFDKGDGVAPSGHKLVLADMHSQQRLPAPTKVPYLPSFLEQRRDVQQFDEWSSTSTLVSGLFDLVDYNYETPTVDMRTHSAINNDHEHGYRRLFDYPGGYDKQDDGARLVNVRKEIEESRNLRMRATGYAPSLTPGFTIKRETPSEPWEDIADYLVVRSSFVYGSQTYASEGKGNAVYKGDYELMNASWPFRMPMRTHRPVIVGTQPAKVTWKGWKEDTPASEQEEIDVDNEGRVRVLFYWNPSGTNPNKRLGVSRYVRVGQVWAGNNRGAYFTPRVGDEVMVAYDEGDPDRPIIVGSVYNGHNKIPLDLPGSNTISGWRTRSSPNGDGYNELQFDDKKGDELVYVHAEKDLSVEAKHDEKRKIGNDQTETVHRNLSQTVQTGNMKVEVCAGAYTLTAAQSITLKVAGSSLRIDPTGITLDAPMLTLKGSAIINLKSVLLSLNADAISTYSAPLIAINGSALVTIGGGACILAAPTLAASIAGMTPAGVPLI